MPTTLNIPNSVGFAHIEGVASDLTQFPLSGNTRMTNHRFHTALSFFESQLPVRLGSRCRATNHKFFHSNVISAALFTRQWKRQKSASYSACLVPSAVWMRIRIVLLHAHDLYPCRLVQVRCPPFHGLREGTTCFTYTCCHLNYRIGYPKRLSTRLNPKFNDW